MNVDKRKPKMTPTTLDVLEVLLSGDKELYGLKIAQTTGVTSGTVYPILARLEAVGWVEGHWESTESTDRGPRRKFYRLTPTGLQEARTAVDARDAKRRSAAAKRLSLGLDRLRVARRLPDPP